MNDSHRRRLPLEDRPSTHCVRSGLGVTRAGKARPEAEARVPEDRAGQRPERERGELSRTRIEPGRQGSGTS